MQAADFSTCSDGFDLENIMSLELDKACTVVFSSWIRKFGPCLCVLWLSTLLGVRIPEECWTRTYIEEQDKCKDNANYIWRVRLTAFHSINFITNKWTFSTNPPFMQQSRPWKPIFLVSLIWSKPWNPPRAPPSPRHYMILYISSFLGNLFFCKEWFFLSNTHESFFLEHAGELRIISLIRERKIQKKGTRKQHKHKHTQTNRASARVYEQAKAFGSG